MRRRYSRLNPPGESFPTHQNEDDGQHHGLFGNILALVAVPEFHNKISHLGFVSG